MAHRLLLGVVVYIGRGRAIGGIRKWLIDIRWISAKHLYLLDSLIVRGRYKKTINRYPLNIYWISISIRYY